MGLKDSIESQTLDLVRKDFNVRRGYTVPESEEITMADGAVRIDAAFMYSDLANSSKLARDHSEEDAAKVIRAFLNAATQVMKNRGGEIRSFDGDRVMGIFIGSDGPSHAARAALELTWVIDEIVRPKVELWIDSVYESGWILRHGTGIAHGETFLVRGGVRGDNDLVSIGDAPNIAAKLSELRDHRTWITDDMWEAMSYETCITKNENMWSYPESRLLGDRWVPISYSDWTWVVS